MMTSRRAVSGLIAFGVLGASVFVLAPGEEPATPERAITPEKERHRGVSWVAGREVSARDFEPLVESRVNWIVQTPFGWQSGLGSPEIRMATSGRILWGETDAGLESTTKLARRHGIRTLLKPHVWTGRAWRGEIRMASDAQWQEWFASYRRFILHYARFAQAQGIEVLCIGTELRSTVNSHPQEWRRIITEIKDVYRGQLTYAANWYAEFEEVPFWDELDYIGIQAYFPLSDDEEPTTEALVAGWQKHLERIERIQKRYRKPVLFTEIGYRSVADTAGRPWEWPNPREAPEVDLKLQADCYEAFFRTFWDKPWFAGVYWWKWFPKHERSGGPQHAGFTPQNKPAQKVITEWFGRP